MKSIVAVIEWYGPYTVQGAQEVSKFDYDDGLYIVLGKTKYQRSTHLQYIGVASNLCSRLNGFHHKIPLVTKDCEIWLGEVASPRTPGKKIKVTDRMLDLAEWAHTYFLQLPLNDKKKTNPPDRPIVTYNRWWRKDYETSFQKRPHKEWPDIIDFSGIDYDAKVVWFGGRQIIRPARDFTS